MRSCLNSLLPPFVVSEVGKNKLLQALLSQFFFDSLHERPVFSLRQSGQSSSAKLTASMFPPARPLTFGAGTDGENNSILSSPFGFFVHLITLSARANTFGGIVSPICLAVFKLMTNSNFVGCSTGRSAGLVPSRILSTYVAARRSKSIMLMP